MTDRSMDEIYRRMHQIREAGMSHPNAMLIPMDTLCVCGHPAVEHIEESDGTMGACRCPKEDCLYTGDACHRFAPDLQRTLRRNCKLGR